MLIPIQKIATWAYTHKLLFFYIFMIQFLLVLLIFKPNLASKISNLLGYEHPNSSVKYNYQSMKTMLTRIDKNTKKNRVFFIGDSLIQGMAVNSIHPKAVNFGIGHDTINGVLERVLTYQAMRNAKAVVISVGINDLRYNSVEVTLTSYRTLLEKISFRSNLYIHSILPIDSNVLGKNLQMKVTHFNQKLLKLASEFTNTHVLKHSKKLVNSKGHLKSSLHLGDGLHLNSRGYNIWINQLQLQLDTHE